MHLIYFPTKKVFDLKTLFFKFSLYIKLDNKKLTIF